jgi:hypothetical protein
MATATLTTTETTTRGTVKMSRERRAFALWLLREVDWDATLGHPALAGLMPEQIASVKAAIAQLLGPRDRQRALRRPTRA